MLAIFAYGRADGTTLVAIDGNGSYTDLYIRGTGGGVQIAPNSEFVGPGTFDPLDWTHEKNSPNPNIYSPTSIPSAAGRSTSQTPRRTSSS
jgi:hypothetical protein